MTFPEKLAEARAEVDRLKGLQKDHEDDWKRIQDSERECERLKAELLSLNIMKTFDKVSMIQHFPSAKQLLDEIARLRQALEHLADGTLPNGDHGDGCVARFARQALKDGGE